MISMRILLNVEILFERQPRRSTIGIGIRRQINRLAIVDQLDLSRVPDRRGRMAAYRAELARCPGGLIRERSNLPLPSLTSVHDSPANIKSNTVRSAIRAWRGNGRTRRLARRPWGNCVRRFRHNGRRSELAAPAAETKREQEQGGSRKLRSTFFLVSAASSAGDTRHRLLDLSGVEGAAASVASFSSSSGFTTTFGLLADISDISLVTTINLINQQQQRQNDHSRDNQVAPSRFLLRRKRNSFDLVGNSLRRRRRKRLFQ